MAFLHIILTHMWSFYTLFCSLDPVTYFGCFGLIKTTTSEGKMISSTLGSFLSYNFSPNGDVRRFLINGLNLGFTFGSNFLFLLAHRII